MKYCIFYLFILFVNISYLYSQPRFKHWIPPSASQPLHTHSVDSIFPTLRISEDFGPRKLNGDFYQWHGGIDYNSGPGNSDYGDLILALEGGTISTHSHMTTNIKSLMIEGNNNLRYVHVFEGGVLSPTNTVIETGACILKFMDAPNNLDWAIIIQDNGVYTSFAATPGFVTFSDEAMMSQTIAVSTIVAIDSPVVPLGTSSNYPAHLHLEILTQTTTNSGAEIGEGNDLFAKDPLQLYNHDVPDLNIGFFHADDVTTGINLIYPGTNEETIQLHVEIDGQGSNTTVNRYNEVMNVDNVKILVKKGCEPNYDLIEGPHFESEFSHGARIGQNRKLMALDVPNGNVPLWDVTHMQPFAYSSNDPNRNHTSHPRDDYYFADFVSRIHENDNSSLPNISTLFAYNNEQARYPDGNYEFRAEIVDVRDTIVYGDTLDVIIDNYKPYLTRLDVYLQDPIGLFTTHLYTFEMTEGGCTNQLKPIGFSPAPNTFTSCDQVFFTATTSEPLLDDLVIEFTIKDGMTVDTTFIVTCDPENCSTKWDMRVNLDVDVY